MRKILDMNIRQISILLFTLGVLTAVVGSLNHHYLINGGANGSIIGELLEQNYANLTWELFSILITVNIIDVIYSRRDQSEIQSRYLREVRSDVHEVAIKAVEELRELGFLTDGTLHGHEFWDGRLMHADFSFAELAHANFSQARLHDAIFNQANLFEATLYSVTAPKAMFHGANLADARLSGANLREADFLDADLFNTTLSLAFLGGARNLNNQQLVLAKSLWRTELPDRTIYDGRFNLADDIEGTQFYGVDSNDDEQMAGYYNVPLATYLEGQNWARENLGDLRARAIEMRQALVEEKGIGLE